MTPAQRPSAAALLQHQAAVRGLAQRLLSAAEADDIEQEVWLRALKAQELPILPGSLRAWLLTVTRNVCTDQLRLRTRRPFGRLVDEPIAPPPDDGAQRRVRDLLAALPESLRAVTVAHHLDGMSYEAIHERTGLSIAAIAQRLWRARRQLRLASDVDAAATGAFSPPCSATTRTA